MNRYEITLEEFEDTLFDPNLIVVQKEVPEKECHTTCVYVIENDVTIYSVDRVITSDGVTFWKEIFDV
ncbi:cef modifier of supressor tRNAs [Pectobacterium bacteriophage PM2]|uniref:Putative cef modifier of suppressor tRNAs n=1 Tax=Pectobacterium bacteriophage PM2 TaxID=1429794 RepID=A0A0A0Q092_9CAUD|nr:cef modifier of supressor tRNAs [Pectobacterium bacteriophage PM2]AHY24971.1 putative cef modifier of suppressor tRNAs [Pectobacterium bacteriophage PM2]